MFTMRRFEVGNTRERELPWGKIMFTNKYYITVETPTLTILFHRYGAPKGHYRLWSYFRQALMSRELEDIYDVYKYANKFDVLHFVKETRLVEKHHLTNTRSKNGKNH